MIVSIISGNSKHFISLELSSYGFKYRRTNCILVQWNLLYTWANKIEQITANIDLTIFGQSIINAFRSAAQIRNLFLANKTYIRYFS